MNVVEKAIAFATKAHEGQRRKLTDIPYILHPLEVASIIASITEDQEIIAAGCLHDTIEDTSTTPEDIEREFGLRVYGIVLSETEDKLSQLPPEATWKIRKEESLLMLEHTKDEAVKILWLADKLSNMRSFYRTWLKIGDDVWLQLHQKDKLEHEWYYRSIAHLLTDYKDTAAYMEYVDILDKVFGEEKNGNN